MSQRLARQRVSSLSPPCTRVGDALLPLAKHSRERIPVRFLSSALVSFHRSKTDSGPAVRVLSVSLLRLFSKDGDRRAHPGASVLDRQGGAMGGDHWDRGAPPFDHRYALARSFPGGSRGLVSFRVRSGLSPLRAHPAVPSTVAKSGLVRGGPSFQVHPTCRAQRARDIVRRLTLSGMARLGWGQSRTMIHPPPPARRGIRGYPHRGRRVVGRRTRLSCARMHGTGGPSSHGLNSGPITVIRQVSRIRPLKYRPSESLFTAFRGARCP